MIICLICMILFFHLKLFWCYLLVFIPTATKTKQRSQLKSLFRLNFLLTEVGIFCLRKKSMIVLMVPTFSSSLWLAGERIQFPCQVHLHSCDGPQGDPSPRRKQSRRQRLLWKQEIGVGRTGRSPIWGTLFLFLYLKKSTGVRDLSSFWLVFFLISFFPPHIDLFLN